MTFKESAKTNPPRDIAGGGPGRCPRRNLEGENYQTKPNSPCGSRIFSKFEANSRVFLPHPERNYGASAPPFTGEEQQGRTWVLSETQKQTHCESRGKIGKWQKQSQIMQQLLALYLPDLAETCFAGPFLVGAVREPPAAILRERKIFAIAPSLRVVRERPLRQKRRPHEIAESSLAST